MLVAEMADFGGLLVSIADAETGRAYTMAGLYSGQPFIAPNNTAAADDGTVCFKDSRYQRHDLLSTPGPLFAEYRPIANSLVSQPLSEPPTVLPYRQIKNAST